MLYKKLNDFAFSNFEKWSLLKLISLQNFLLKSNISINKLKKKNISALYKLASTEQPDRVCPQENWILV